MDSLMIFERKGAAVVSSRVIAEKFEKDHKNVLQSIETLISQIRSAENSAHLRRE